MSDEREIYEVDRGTDEPDPDEVPIRDRRVITQPYDLVLESLIDQIRDQTIFLRPLSDRPNFQRRYVWPDILACRLIESILLNVPIPPCYLSQNEDFELDVIDGQQRLFSLFRFLDNRFSLSRLEVLTELNGLKFFQLPAKLQRQLKTHTLRCILITNESHPEIKFDVFERLNTNTVPLNAQELRNCVYRGALNSLLQEVVTDKRWLSILRKREPDSRMRDEELALRFFAFWINGVDLYRTPLKHWLNRVAAEGRKFDEQKIKDLRSVWDRAIGVTLQLFEPHECFRRPPLIRQRSINRALFDLIMMSAAEFRTSDVATEVRDRFRESYEKLLHNEEFADLISRSVDHTKRTKRRFEMWNGVFSWIRG